MLDDIAPDLPQCPIALIEHQLRKTTIARARIPARIAWTVTRWTLSRASRSRTWTCRRKPEPVGVVDMTLDGNCHAVD